MNSLKTGLLLAALTALLVLFGRLLGGAQGMAIAFVVALVMNGVTYWFSDRIVLAMYRAKELGPGEAPELTATVSRLCRNAGLPVPRLYVIPTDTPNAFATGRDPQHAAVAVTEGLLRMLDHPEVEGVLAHELSHVKNRDTLIATVAASIAGAITMVANWVQMAAFFGGYRGDDEEGGHGNALGMLLMAILAPIAALLIQMAISRSREYLADSAGAGLTGRPLALASALQKLEIAAQRRPLPANPATAHMFIVNPLVGGLSSLFSTHPGTEERIAHLEAMAGETAGRAAYVWR